MEVQMGNSPNNQEYYHCVKIDCLSSHLYMASITTN